MRFDRVRRERLGRRQRIKCSAMRRSRVAGRARHIPPRGMTSCSGCPSGALGSRGENLDAPRLRDLLAGIEDQHVLDLGGHEGVRRARHVFDGPAPLRASISRCTCWPVNALGLHLPACRSLSARPDAAIPLLGMRRHIDPVSSHSDTTNPARPTQVQPAGAAAGIKDDQPSLPAARCSRAPNHEIIPRWPMRHAPQPQTMNSMTGHYDVIIVGSGTDGHVKRRPR